MILSLALLLALQDPTPVPAADAVKDAEKAVREQFKTEYAAKSPTDRVALAKKLLAKAETTTDDPAGRYVMLREANVAAAAAGDLRLALSAAEQTGRFFKVDVLALKSETLQSAAKNAKTPEELLQLATACLKLSKDATDVDDFSAAEKAAASAGTHARKAQNAAMATRATARVKEIGEIKARYEKTVRKSKETLAASPEDPGANLEVGQHECFTKGNWTVGLPHLARSSDAALKDLAARDLAAPSTPEDQATVGDGWWDAAEKRPAGSRTELRARAKFWYEKTDGKLQGASLARVEKRLVELRSESLGQGTWIDVSDPKLYGVKARAVILTVGETAKLAKWPEGEFDGITYRVKAAPGKGGDLRLTFQPDDRCVVVYQKQGSIQVAKLQGQNLQNEVLKKCPVKEEYVVHLLFSEGECVGYVDGREIFRNTTLRNTLTGYEFNSFTAGSDPVAIDQIKLRKR